MDTAASARPARGREHLAGAIPGARMMAAAGAAAGLGARGGVGGGLPGSYNTGRHLRVPTPSTAGHGHEAHELATYRDQLVTGSFIMCPWQVWFKMDLECYCSSQT